MYIYIYIVSKKMVILGEKLGKDHIIIKKMLALGETHDIIIISKKMLIMLISINITINNMLLLGLNI
jgi:hypothetical protein